MENNTQIWFDFIASMQILVMNTKAPCQTWLRGFAKLQVNAPESDQSERWHQMAAAPEISLSEFAQWVLMGNATWTGNAAVGERVFQKLKRIAVHGNGEQPEP